MQQTASAAFSYPRIHAPVMVLAKKAAHAFEDEDVIAGLKKIYTGSIDREICLNMTALDDFRQAVELALLLHVRRDSSDKNVILTDAARLARRKTMDFVGIFMALYAAVKKGDMTSDSAWTLVQSQIALRKSVWTDSQIHQTIASIGVFKERPVQSRERRAFVPILHILTEIPQTPEGVRAAFGDRLPQDIEITGAHMHAAFKFYKELLTTIA
jgi:hypothetical protein